MYRGGDGTGRCTGCMQLLWSAALWFPGTWRCTGSGWLWLFSACFCQPWWKKTDHRSGNRIWDIRICDLKQIFFDRKICSWKPVWVLEVLSATDFHCRKTVTLSYACIWSCCIWSTGTGIFLCGSIHSHRSSSWKLYRWFYCNGLFVRVVDDACL